MVRRNGDGYSKGEGRMRKSWCRWLLVICCWYVHTGAPARIIRRAIAAPVCFETWFAAMNFCSVVDEDGNDLARPTWLPRLCSREPPVEREHTHSAQVASCSKSSWWYKCARHHLIDDYHVYRFIESSIRRMGVGACGMHEIQMFWSYFVQLYFLQLAIISSVSEDWNGDRSPDSCLLQVLDRGHRLHSTNQRLIGNRVSGLGPVLGSWDELAGMGEGMAEWGTFVEPIVESGNWINALIQRWINIESMLSHWVNVESIVMGFNQRWLNWVLSQCRFATLSPPCWILSIKIDFSVNGDSMLTGVNQNSLTQFNDNVDSSALIVNVDSHKPNRP